jgi:hypothetical protein
MPGGQPVQDGGGASQLDGESTSKPTSDTRPAAMAALTAINPDDVVGDRRSLRPDAAGGERQQGCRYAPVAAARTSSSSLVFHTASSRSTIVPDASVTNSTGS